MFPGFYRPRANFYKLPNDWFDLWIGLRRRSGQSRVIGPLKVAAYTIKWSWGYQNYGRPVRISYRNFQFGQQRAGRRLDRGTGLSSRGVQNALACLLELNVLERHEADGGDGPAYLPHLRPPEEDGDPFLGPSAEADGSGAWRGFDRPETNYFEVPALWTDLTSSVTSAAVVLAVEYFFRHTWGWHRNRDATRPVWMSAQEVAGGRRDRSGERYDDGIGYSVRSVRPALAEAVQRGWLVWRADGDTGRRQYALHLKGMRVADDGRFLAHADEEMDQEEPDLSQQSPLKEEPVALPPAGPEAPSDGVQSLRIQESPSNPTGEMAALQAQVAALTDAVVHLQELVRWMLEAAAGEESKAPPEDVKARGEGRKAEAGRCYSASYADRGSNSPGQKAAAKSGLSSGQGLKMGDAAAGDANPDGSGSGKKPDPALARLLDRLGVRGRRRRQVEASATYAAALAWALYAGAQPGLTRNKAGYVVQRLVEGEPSPAEFAPLAALPLETVTLFRRAVRYGGPYREAVPDGLLAQFRRWQRRFPFERVPLDDAPRRGADWDPPPARHVDGLEDLLGSVEVDPEAAWAAVCDALAARATAEDLEALHRCWVTTDETLRPSLSLWPPDGDPAAGKLLSTHEEAIRTALGGLGIRHELKMQTLVEPLDLEL